MKLIKINTDHYIIVDDSEIKEGDSFYSVRNLIEKAIINYPSGEHIGKITHSTQPLEEGITIHNIEHKRWVYIKYIDLLEVKELIGEVDVEKKAEYNWMLHTEGSIVVTDKNDWKSGFHHGYTQALEDNKDKKYTEEDVIAIVEKSRATGLTAEYIIQSLQPKTEWEVEFINGKLKLM